MRYSKYSSYRDSRVEWLGDVPEGWISSPLKYLLSEPLMYGANESADRDNHNDPRYIRITDIKKDGTLHNDTFRSLPMEIAKPYLLKNNSLLLARSGATVGKTFLYEESWGVSCFAGYLIKVRLLPTKAQSKFVSYFTKTTNYWQWINNSQIQSTIENVSAEKYANLNIPIPPLKEQQTIANYLDIATAKIDTLIEKQTKLIALLKEKRQAVISTAVTRGLDNKVAMKDSGVEWLGEIPEHWEVKKTKNIFSLIIEPAHANNTYELLSIYTDIGVKPRKDLEQKGNKATTTDGYWKVQKKDIIVNKLLAWMGAIGVSDYDGVTSPAYDILRPKKDISSDFYHLLFRTKKAQTEFKKYSRGIMEMRLRLYFSEFGQIKMPVPCYDEQVEIINSVKERTSKIDNLTLKATKAIDLLKEKRTALISSAVTGKIDVREIA